MVFKHQSFHEEPPVVETEFPPEAKLEGAVSDALGSVGGIDATAVHVIAQGTTIVLTGKVMYDSEVQRAEEVARSVPGVTDVRNEVTTGKIA
ncbi:MAG: BON domain-containing protein [Pseudorhizobium sp.]